MARIITTFHVTDATLENPDKLHPNIEFGAEQRVEIFFKSWRCGALQVNAEWQLWITGGVGFKVTGWK